MGLSKESLEVLQEQSRKDLISYCCYTNDFYDPQPFHEQIANKLHGVIEGKIKRLIINIPPQHGKSQLSSVDFTTYLLGLDPKMRVMAASYSATLIQHFSKLARDKVNSQAYKDLFPDTILSSEGVEHRDTTKGGYYHAVGVGGASTGFGFGVGVIDDPFKDREEAESEVIRNKVRDWYTSTFYTRQGKEAAIILIMTRWHIDDLAGRLLKSAKEGGEQWEQLIIPAIVDGKAIWESKYSLEYLKQTEINIGQRDFAALYMQDPIKSTGSIFKPSTFKYKLESDFEKQDGVLKKDDLEFGLFIDPAFSTSTHSDDAVVIAGARHKITGDFYKFETYADTSAPSDTIRAIFNMIDRWEIKGYKVDFVSIEKVSINKEQDKFIRDFRQEMQNRNRYYTVYEYIPKQKKENRIKFNLEKMFDNGKIYFIKGNDVTEQKRMEEQLTLFPFSKHDDIIDCLSQMVEVLETKGLKPENNQKRPPIISPRTMKPVSLSILKKDFAY